MKNGMLKLVALVLTFSLLVGIFPCNGLAEGEELTSIHDDNADNLDSNYDSMSLGETLSNIWRDITLFIEDGLIRLFGNEDATIDYEQGETTGTADGVTITNRDPSVASDNSVVIDAQDGDVELTIKDLNIDGGYIDVWGNVSIEIDGENEIIAPSAHPGVQVISGDSLTINDTNDDGLLDVTGGYNAPGLGGEGGGGYHNATAQHGEIIINGGTIIANGNGDSAGIGSGQKTYGYFEGKDDGSIIVINSGDVTAIGNVGIGGSNSSTVGEIIINGGTVYAEGTYDSAIGGGTFTHFGQITINGGDITAVSQYGSAIGGEINNGEGGVSIDITGGSLTANGGSVNYWVSNYGEKIPDIGADKYGNISIATGAINLNALVDGTTIASTGENGDSVYHIHVYSKLTTDTAATCTSPRLISFNCLDPECPEKTVNNYSIGDALGHDFVRDPQRDVIATPERNGIEAYTCSRCSEHDDKVTEYDETICSHSSEDYSYVKDISIQPQYVDAEDGVNHYVLYTYNCICNECSQFVMRTLGKIENADTETHVYDESDVCVCGALREAVCAHETYIDVYDDSGTRAMIVEIVDAENHSVRNPYIRKCADCGAVLDYPEGSDGYFVAEPEAHTFDDDGVCTICHYSPAVCEHKNHIDVYDDSGVREIIVAIADSETHSVRSPYIRKCADCGAVLDYPEGSDGYFVAEPEAHTFDKNGICTVCKYEKNKASIQTNSVATTVTTATVSGNLKFGDGETSAQYQYAGIQYGAAGKDWEATVSATLNTNGSIEGTVTGLKQNTEYRFRAVALNADGEYVVGNEITGATKGCSHPTYTQSDDTSTYVYYFREIPGNDAMHECYAYGIPCACSVCGEDFVSVIEKTDTEPSKHVYENGVCVANGCGHVCGHDFSEYRCYAPESVYLDDWKTLTGVKELPQPTYSNITEEMHVVHNPWMYCCSLCGMLKVEMEPEEPVQHTYAHTTYSNKTDTQHIENKLCECGKVLSSKSSGHDWVILQINPDGRITDDEHMCSGICSQCNYRYDYVAQKHSICKTETREIFDKADNNYHGYTVSVTICDCGYETYKIINDLGLFQHNDADDDGFCDFHNDSVYRECFGEYTLNLNADALKKPITDASTFDIHNITGVVYLNATKNAYLGNMLGLGAYIIPGNQGGGAGHAAILLTDINGNSVYFSCDGGRDGNAFFVLRYLNTDDTNRFLKSGKGLASCVELNNTYLVGYFKGDVLSDTAIIETFESDWSESELADYMYTNTGDRNDIEYCKVAKTNCVTNEGDFFEDHAAYDRYASFKCSTADGMAMYEAVIEKYNSKLPYDYFDNNCDWYALDILSSGFSDESDSLFIKSEFERLKDAVLLPNNTFPYVLSLSQLQN